MKTSHIVIVILVLISVVVLGHGPASSPPPNEDRRITFPDTREYFTLVLDPHTHSVFSDGHVWPRIRVEEALRDGLDAIAITEHLEYQPHLEDIPHKDRNRAYEVAASSAEGLDLMVVPGVEITRKAPASHMNALFIKDANVLFSNPEPGNPFNARDYSTRANKWPAQLAVDAANEQGAFIFWNHSWWARDFPNGIPEVSDFHKNNAQRGLLHGIEIANGKNYSEDAFQIALDYNLTLMGVSDVHSLIDWDYQPHKGGHRPVTLVLAEERTAESMKEALFDRRTVVWFKNWLMGREPHLDSLLQACLSIEQASYGDGEILQVSISNQSDADFHLRNLGPYDFHLRAGTLVIPQHSTEKLLVRTGTRVEKFTLKFEVLNAFTAPNQTTMISLEAGVE